MPETVEIGMVELKGRAAAPGLARGPVFRIPETVVHRRGSGDPERERAALVAAIASAVDELAGLMAASAGEGGEMLEFQIAMLEDEALRAPALDAIAAGADAATAWSAALAGEIAHYRASDDDYFRARASDFEDLRDRVLGHLAGAGADDAAPPGAILVGRDLTPSRFLAIDWSQGGAIALSEGSPSSHVAMLARSRGVPMAVGLGAIPDRRFAEAIVDGEEGRLVLDPAADDLAAFARARAQAEGRARLEAAGLGQPARTLDGITVAVLINVAEPEELDHLDPAMCDGIGLVRTEFLFHRPSGLPDEETQYQAYRRILAWAGERPVTIRTVDAGGDKPVPGLTMDGESNPFLGMRGIRLSLVRREIFRDQLRALARAAVHGRLKVMLPMVTVPEEIAEASAMLDASLAELAEKGVACARPPLGIMVEVPAVAVVPDLYGAAAFFSVGSNDLTQYTTASARDIAAVAGLNDPGHPAVLALIRNLVERAGALGRDVSLCGDMGGDPRHLPALLKAGLRSLSVAPPLVGRVKEAIRGLRAGGP